MCICARDFLNPDCARDFLNPDITMQYHKPPVFTNLDHAKTYLQKHNYVAINIISKTKSKHYLSELESYVMKNNLKPGQLHDSNIGHDTFMLNIRKEPKVIAAFEKIWNCDKLQESYDGASYTIPTKTKSVLWPHVDMNTITLEHMCYQGLVNLTNCTNQNDGGFVIWEFPLQKSIKYIKQFPSTNNYTPILAPKYPIPTKILLDSGTLLLWNSHMIHCNVPPNKYSKNNRAILYVCMVPKAQISKAALAELYYFKKMKTTTKHNPFIPSTF